MSANKRIKLSLSKLSSKKIDDPLSRFCGAIKFKQTENSYKKTL